MFERGLREAAAVRLAGERLGISALARVRGSGGVAAEEGGAWREMGINACIGRGVRSAADARVSGAPRAGGALATSPTPRSRDVEWQM